MAFSGTNLLANFANLSFLSLFAAMFCYWFNIFKPDGRSQNKNSQTIVEPSLTGNNNSSPILSNSSNILANGFSYTGPTTVFPKTETNFKIGTLLIGISNILLVLLLGLRWKESGHFPLSNLYESLMFLSWSFTVLHLIIENMTIHVNLTLSSNSAINLSPSTPTEGKRVKGPKTFNLSKVIGAITAPSALFTNAFATFTLPKEMQEASPLVPALQSNWLMMHVTVMILSYAALIIGSLLSIAYLIISVKTTEKKQEKLAETLDNLSYRIIGIGFPFLTIGILSGAVWANEAWGSYWSWDPKETWALLTWLIFAIYLHTRLNKGWEGQKPAFIATFGFIIVWICYLGVNLLGSGLHSYGWFA